MEYGSGGFKRGQKGLTAHQMSIIAHDITKTFMRNKIKKLKFTGMMEVLICWGDV